MSHSAADHRAAAAVVAHHTQLAADLAGHTARLREAATAGEAPAPGGTPAGPDGSGQEAGAPWRHHQRTLVGWLHRELLPHAAAEEGALYPAAAGHPAGRLLVDGMLAEHRAITALVGELAGAGDAVAAAAAARALSALFEAHLAKENDLILPLLLAADDISLAGLLDGMHDLLGG
jgi:hypothetical protein